MTNQIDRGTDYGREGSEVGSLVVPGGAIGTVIPDEVTHESNKARSQLANVLGVAVAVAALVAAPGTVHAEQPKKGEPGIVLRSKPNEPVSLKDGSAHQKGETGDHKKWAVESLLGWEATFEGRPTVVATATLAFLSPEIFHGFQVVLKGLGEVGSQANNVEEKPNGVNTVRSLRSAGLAMAGLSYHALPPLSFELIGGAGIASFIYPNSTNDGRTYGLSPILKVEGGVALHLPKHIVIDIALGREWTTNGLHEMNKDEVTRGSHSAWTGGVAVGLQWMEF